jgi:hypothetical protein
MGREPLAQGWLFRGGRKLFCDGAYDIADFKGIS